MYYYRSSVLHSTHLYCLQQKKAGETAGTYCGDMVRETNGERSLRCYQTCQLLTKDCCRNSHEKLWPVTQHVCSPTTTALWSASGGVVQLEPHIQRSRRPLSVPLLPALRLAMKFIFMTEQARIDRIHLCIVGGYSRWCPLWQSLC
jgi:hypothetical protein